MRPSTDIAIVGSGPAGIGAALAASRNGASVVIVDENDAPGGHLRWTMARQSGFDGVLEDLRGCEIAAWAAGALAEAGVEVLTSTVAWGLFEATVLGVTNRLVSYQLDAGQVIIATGSTDLTWPFPGWELPGVMTATAALRLMHLDRVLPGRHVAVVGDRLLAVDVASDLDACGGVVVHRQPTVTDVNVGGHKSVEWIDVGGQRHQCDCVVLAIGRQPDAQLALQIDVALTYSSDDGGFIVARDDTFVTTVAGVYVVGDARGIVSPAQAYAEGVVAGEAATGGSGLTAARSRLLAIERRMERRPTFPTIADNTIVCRCEEVRASVVRDAIEGGSISLNDASDGLEQEWVSVRVSSATAP